MSQHAIKGSSQLETINYGYGTSNIVFTAVIETDRFENCPIGR